MKTSRDAVEDEVRRRYANYLAEAGVDHGRVATEILFMLPAEFVRAYAELFDMSLVWAGSVKIGDEGSVKKPGQIGGKDPLNARTIRSAVGGGKRWRKMPWAVRSELALKEKTKLDRRIVDGVGNAIRAARRVEDMAPDKRDEKEGIRCPMCGRGAGKSWIFCPFDGSKLLTR